MTIQEGGESPSYWTLPHRGQIFMLVLCRITEPIAYSSISPYLYYMIRDFGFSDPSVISSLCTLVIAAFPLGQTLTSVGWGRLSDIVGRKVSLCCGLIGTATAIFTLGLSTNIYMLFMARLMMGLLNGNIGVIRTMVAELVVDHKEYQTRAFSIMPITMNIGMIVGPTLGGFLARPVENMPWLFGNSVLFAKYKYLLPNLVLIPLLLSSAAIVALFIKETGTGPRVLCKNTDWGLALGNKIKRALGYSTEYEQIPSSARSSVDIEQDRDHDHDHDHGEDESDGTVAAPPAPKKPTTIRSVLTHKVKVTLSAYFILMIHAPSFMQLLPLFLSTPRMEETHKNFLMFNGGLGLETGRIGFILSILGVIGIGLQLGVYPALAEKFGNAGVHKRALLLFPIGYLAIPYLCLITSPEGMSSIVMSAVLAAVCVTGRTFSIPPMGVLITNAAPSYKVMGTVQGLTQSVTSAARCIGPFIMGNIYSLGVKVGMVGLAWWTMVGITIIEIIVASRLKEWGEEEEDNTDGEEAQ